MRAIWTALAATLMIMTTADRSVGGDVTLLFENSPQLNDSLGSTADAAGPQWSADDFSIAGSGPFAISEISWWGRFSGLTVPPADTSNFVIQIFRGVAGPQIDPWVQFTVGAASRTVAGQAGGVSLFEFTTALATPLILQGGETYYFSVYNDNGIDDERFAILWSSTSEAQNRRWFRQNQTRAWTASGSNVNTAFRLSGQAVPEPSSVLLLGSAGIVGAIGAWRSRRRPLD